MQLSSKRKKTDPSQVAIQFCKANEDRSSKTARWIDDNIGTVTYQDYSILRKRDRRVLWKVYLIN